MTLFSFAFLSCHHLRNFLIFLSLQRIFDLCPFLLMALGLLYIVQTLPLNFYNPFHSESLKLTQLHLSPFISICYWEVCSNVFFSTQILCIILSALMFCLVLFYEQVASEFYIPQTFLNHRLPEVFPICLWVSFTCFEALPYHITTLNW